MFSRDTGSASVFRQSDNKIGGGGGPDGDFEFSGSLETLVDAKQIGSIELFGVRVPLAKRQ